MKKGKYQGKPNFKAINMLAKSINSYNPQLKSNMKLKITLNSETNSTTKKGFDKSLSQLNFY